MIVKTLNKKYFICRSVKFRHLLSLLFREGLVKGNRPVICYLNPNKTSIFLERFTKVKKEGRLGKLSLVCLNYDFLKMRNDKGIPLLIASVKDDLYQAIEKIGTECHPGNSLLDQLDDRLAPVKEDLRSYIKQRIALDIFEDLYLVNLTHWLATDKESELYGKSLVILLEKKSYWNYLVLDFAKSKKVSYLVFHSMDLKRNKGALFVYHLLKVCVEIIVSSVRGRRTKRPSSEAKIGVPFYLLQNFVNFFELRNYYLFWFYKSGISPEKVLIYVPERKFNINEDEVIGIKKSGFNIVAGPTQPAKKGSVNLPVHKCTFNTAALLFKYLKQIIKISRAAKGRLMKEEWKLLSLLFVQLPYWEDFFKENNIRVKFRFHDMFSAREIAAKIAGVVTMSYHYSNQSDMTILHQDICDVFFVWGKKYEKSLSGEHSTIANFIQTGYVFDYTFDNLKNKARELRDTFKGRKVLYIIGIFDEFIGGCFTAPQLRAYRAVLEYAQSRPDIGVIIKPKKEHTIQHLISSVEVSKLVSNLEKQGRIMILDSRKFPAEAGQASDIVIGMIPDSTAGLECALAGTPMVIYDIFSMTCHPFYEWGHNKIIFNDIQYLLNLLNINREKPGSIPGFADWTPIFDTVDPFRDGKANQRIGAYIKTLLLKLDEGLAKNEAIKAANRVYMNEFGLDKVTSIMRP